MHSATTLRTTLPRLGVALVALAFTGGTALAEGPGPATSVVSGNRTTTAGLDGIAAADTKERHVVAQDFVEKIGRDSKQTIGRDASTTVMRNNALSVGLSSVTTVGVTGASGYSAGTDTTLESGRKITVEAGKTLVLKAGSGATDSIELRTGSASIVLKGNGEIEIRGTKITIQSSGDLVLKGQRILN